MATATVSYRGELSDLRAKLASITDITRAEARVMVRDLNRSMRAVEKAQARAVKASGSYSEAVRGAGAASSGLARASQSVAMQLPDVAAQLAAGTPPAQVFAQQGLQVVQSNMQSLLGLMARFAPAMGVLGAALAIGAAAYWQLSKSAEAAEAKMRAASAAATAAQSAHAQLEVAVAEVDEAFARATGSYDALAVAQEKRDSVVKASIATERRAIEAAYDKAAAAHAEARAAAASAKTNYQKYNANKALEESEVALARAQAARDRQLEALATKEREVLQRSAQATALTREREAAEAALSEQTKAQQEAARARAAAEREAAKADREALLLARERAAATDNLSRIQQASTLSVLDGEARLAVEYRRQMEAINDLERVSQDKAAADAARAAVREEYELELWQLRRDRAQTEAAEQERLSAQAAQARIRHEQQVQQARQQSANNWLQATQVATTALSQSFEQGSVAAKAFYGVAQGVAAAQALIYGIQAGMAALAPPPLGLGPVAGGPLSASMIALGGVQAAAIMGTTVASFSDTPGPVRVGPGGMTASYPAGDLVVAGRDEGDLVRQMQRAGIGMGGGSEILVVDADRHHGRYGRDPMRAPDRYRPMRRRAGRIPGRR